MAFEEFAYNNPTLLEVEKNLSENKLQEAASLLNRLQQQGTEDARIYFLGSRLGQLAGNNERALSAVDRAIEMVPGWSRAVMQRAFLLTDMGRDEEALEACALAIQYNPRAHEAAFYAAEIGKRIGNQEIPERLLLTAHQAKPNAVKIWFELGRFFASFDLARSLHWLHQVIKVEPNNGEAHQLAALVYEGSDIEKARAHIDLATKAEPENESYRYHQLRLRGETPTKVPADVAQQLFDGYAKRFDTHLVTYLGYRAPKIVAEKILAAYPDRKLNILDLGCGTGLLGLYVGRIEGFFVGVDVSRNMVDEAAKHNVYQRFHLVDINEALEATAENEYEVIAANDVLIYVGDPKPMIEGAHKVLRPGGRFYFTCELAEESEADFVHRSSQRFAHKKSAVKALCDKAGFVGVEFEDMVIRTEAQQPMNGYLVTATKAA